MGDGWGLSGGEGACLEMGPGGHSGPKYPFRRKSKCTFYFDVFRALLNIKLGICVAMNVCIISKHILKSV